MTSLTGPAHEGPAFAPMLEIELALEEFQAEWLHCDGVASYVAGMISHNRLDSVRHANLFSSAFNELLEIAFRAPRRPGARFVCRVSRCADVERVALTFPCAPNDMWMYEHAAGTAATPEAGTRFLAALAGEVSPAPPEILAGLVMECAASMSVERSDTEAAVTLIVDLPLEGLVS